MTFTVTQPCTSQGSGNPPGEEPPSEEPPGEEPPGNQSPPSDNSVFFAVLDAWILESNICMASVSSSIVVLRRVSHNIIFAAGSRDVSSMAIAIYDLNGKPVFRDRATGGGLSWNLRTAEGKPVANGVYFYIATLQGADGSFARGAPKAFVVAGGD